MIKRTVDISEPAYLHMEDRQMLVDKNGEVVATIPIEDLGILILQNPGIVLTQSLIVACQENNVVVIFCDKAHLPYSVILPISDGNSLHTKVLREQVAVSLPTSKRLWQQIVRQKVREQSNTLMRVGTRSAALDRLVEKVKSGDRENHEAQAAQLYWKALMGNNFRRDRTANGVNALLNYGYAIVRAMVARALVGSGLHPAMGLKHQNQYNGLCLADDLMEPFRPWVDCIVYQIRETQEEPVVDRNNKQQLLQLLGEMVIWKSEQMPLMVASHYMAADLRKAYAETDYKLSFPVLATT